jgi:hypothetical protein
VFDEPSSQNQSRSKTCLSDQIIQLEKILSQIQNQLFEFVGLKEENISNGSIGNPWTKNWDFILVTPIVNRLLTVDQSAHFSYQFRRSQIITLLDYLLIELLNQRKKKVLEITIVIIGHQHITNPIDPIESQLNIIVLEIPDIKIILTLNEILFDSSTGAHHSIDHFMLTKKPNSLSKTRRDHVRSVAQNQLGFGILLSYRLNLFKQRTCLGKSLQLRAVLRTVNKNLLDIEGFIIVYFS